MADASLRRAPRVGVDLPVEVTVAAPSRLFTAPGNVETVPIPPELAGAKLDGRVVNLSHNGAFISLATELPPLLARLELSFELDGFGPLEASALVMRRVRGGAVQLSLPSRDALPGVGVLFTDMPLEARRAVADFVRARQNAGRRALVADDSPVIRKLLADALRQLGATETVEVVEAKDGVEALRLIEGQRFDIIITDLEMPGLDGYKLLGHLRAHAELREVPVLAITADQDPEAKARALELGATAFLNKPLQKARLYQAVRELLGV